MSKRPTDPADLRRVSLKHLEELLASFDQRSRATAMQELLNRTMRDSHLHSAALPLFERYLISAADPWTVTMAAEGITYIGGPLRGAIAWNTLLTRPEAMIAAHAALAMEAPQHVPSLLNILAQRPEPELHIAVVRTLGRIGNPAAFEALIGELSIEPVRPHAVQALADFGDVRALPHLQPLLTDRTAAWPEDNHGPMLTVSHIAEHAIRTLSNRQPE